MEQPDLFPPDAGRIGTDESGKGDYFGPLVVAAFFLPEGQEEILRELGVRDSKTTSDNRARDMADILRRSYTHSVVAIGPEKYNQLYERLRNLNRLLAWGHARAIENVLLEKNVKLAVTDQFGDKAFVLNALMKKGRTIELIQKPKAEEDPAVAAASLLARAEFLKRLYFLSQEAGVELPKGSSPQAEAAAVELVKKQGPDVLLRVAKVHFKMTARILAAAR
ncbi:MAG: ribonuclease HIII [Candidatus Aminicenantes bacterium RBG_13_63_10]|nr:MAG: ribonuclease HIII [Candidatus Aminicenantes bacterium RBG_13_63_10]